MISRRTFLEAIPAIGLGGRRLIEPLIPVAPPPDGWTSVYVFIDLGQRATFGFFDRHGNAPSILITRAGRIKMVWFNLNHRYRLTRNGKPVGPGDMLNVGDILECEFLA